MPHFHNHIVLPEHRLVLMLVPKAAGTSIKAALLDAMGYRVPDPVERLPGSSLSLLHNHPAFRFVSAAEALTALGEYDRWAVVRDPIARVVSAWATIQPRRPWVEFLNLVLRTPDPQANIHWRSQYGQLSIEDYRYGIGSLVPTRVYRVESDMDVFWRDLGDRIGYEFVWLRSEGGLTTPARLNVTPWAEKPEVTPAQRAALRERYALDYLVFYGCDAVAPNVEESEG